jgi:CBS domain-containing protein
MPRLKDILQDRPLFAAEAGETVFQAATRMAALNVGAILVLDQGALRGVFSERDLMKRVVVPGLNPETTLVAEVMSVELITGDEETTVEEAMDMMRRCGCRHLPVMRAETVVGFISMRDLMLHELEQKADEIAHMRNYIHGA